MGGGNECDSVQTGAVYTAQAVEQVCMRGEFYRQVYLQQRGRVCVFVHDVCVLHDEWWWIAE